MPSYNLPPELSEISDEFVGDALARVDMEGKVVFKQSAADWMLVPPSVPFVAYWFST